MTDCTPIVPVYINWLGTMAHQSFFVEGRRHPVEVRYDAENADLTLMDLECLPQELADCLNMRTLRICGNRICKLENLPPNLEWLYIRHNQICKLENLPPTLRVLEMTDNQICKLENLPQGLQMLRVDDNQIRKLENLPQTLSLLYVCNNPIEACNINHLNELVWTDLELTEENSALVPRYLKKLQTFRHTELSQDINFGGRAARLQEQDRKQILLDVLACEQFVE